MDFFKRIFDFFSSDKTPGSGFYMALVPMVSAVGDYFLGSGNPVLMGIGAGIAAIYAGAHAIGQGIASKQPTATQVLALPAGVSTVNMSAFGEPKVGPDTIHVADVNAAAPADDGNQARDRFDAGFAAPTPQAPPEAPAASAPPPAPPPVVDTDKIKAIEDNIKNLESALAAHKSELHALGGEPAAPFWQQGPTQPGAFTTPQHDVMAAPAPTQQVAGP